jgi:hypothetical protein
MKTPILTQTLVGARLARDKAGRGRPDIACVLIAGKPRSHRAAFQVEVALK